MKTAETRPCGYTSDKHDHRHSYSELERCAAGKTGTLSDTCNIYWFTDDSCRDISRHRPWNRVWKNHAIVHCSVINYLCLTAVFGAARTFSEHLVMTFLVHSAVTHYQQTEILYSRYFTSLHSPIYW